MAVVLAIGLSFAYALRQAHAAGEPAPLPNLVADPPDNVAWKRAAPKAG